MYKLWGAAAPTSGGSRNLQPGIHLANLVFILHKSSLFFKNRSSFALYWKIDWYSLEYQGIPLAPPLAPTQFLFPF
jgi:hypothetical protein